MTGKQPQTNWQQNSSQKTSIVKKNAIVKPVKKVPKTQIDGTVLRLSKPSKIKSTVTPQVESYEK